MKRETIKIYNYSSNTQHEFNFDNSRVLNRHKYDKNRRVLESFYSHLNQNSINRGYTDIHKIYILFVNYSSSNIKSIYDYSTQKRLYWKKDAVACICLIFIFLQELVYLMQSYWITNHLMKQNLEPPESSGK